MGEAFLVQKNAAIKTPDPVINITNVNPQDVTFRITNPHNENVIATYELNNALPNANTVNINADSFEDITLSSLSENTGYTIYVKIKEIGQVESDVISETFNTPVGSISAAGGSISTINIGNQSYRVHAFTSVGSSTFTVTDAPAGKTIDVLVVAGGGGGGGRHGGGGGAGGIMYGTGISVSPGNYTITVGDGGGHTGEPGRQSIGQNGQNSSAFGATALGGGGGGSYTTNSTAPSGGSGGGGGGRSSSTADNPGSSTQNSSGNFTGYGNSGGQGSNGTAGGGGGGAGGTGGAAQSNDVGGVGGAGRYFGNIFTTNFGENGYFAGGGGGGSQPSRSDNAGGIGGGGNGDGGDNNGHPGIDGTGGGGGGVRSYTTTRVGGDGGSGIVIIRYEI